MHQPLRLKKPLWRQPVALGLLGVLLMVGGWTLSRWRTEISLRAVEQEFRLRELRGMSDDAALNHRLDRIADSTRPEPPFLLFGQLILYAGIGVFLFAAVQMYRAPQGPPPDEMPEPDSESHAETIEEWT